MWRLDTDEFSPSVEMCVYLSYGFDESSEAPPFRQLETSLNCLSCKCEHFNNWVSNNTDSFLNTTNTVLGVEPRLY